MKVRYDHASDALSITVGKSSVISEALWDPEYQGIVVDFPKEDSHDFVGIEVLGLSAYLPLGKRGYDSESDTLLMGRTLAPGVEPELIVENGDIAVYWQTVDDDDADGLPHPVAVAVKRASVHLAKGMNGKTVLEKFKDAFGHLYKSKKKDHTIVFKRGATIHFRKTKTKQGDNTARIHSGRLRHFPNDDRLESYLKRHKVPKDSSQSHPDYLIGPEHADRVIAILGG